MTQPAQTSAATAEPVLHLPKDADTPELATLQQLDTPTADELDEDNNSVLFWISAVGGFILFVCVFLPWVTASLLDRSVALTGLGAVTAPDNFPTAKGGLIEGLIVVILSVLAVALSLFGLYQIQKWFGPAVFGVGLVALGMMAFELANVQAKINQLANGGNNTGVALTNIVPGIGLYVGIGAGVLIVIGGVLPIFFMKPKPKRKRLSQPYWLPSDPPDRTPSVITTIIFSVMGAVFLFVIVLLILRGRGVGA